MLWQDLTKIALLGVENSNFSEQALEVLAQMGVDTTREAPLLLADGAALLAQMRRAGFPLLKFEGELPKPNATSATKTASLKTAHHLNLILSGLHSPVLPEFLFLLKKSGRTLPPAEIPALMRLPELPLFWPQIQPLLGDSGCWLLRQHPDWSAKLQDPRQFDWMMGSRMERLAQFKFWRNESPAFALELLQKTWDTESPMDKAAFLTQFVIGLSLADEPFLERCLDDRRKEVRQAIPPLLAKIPGSQLANRMAKRVENCLLVKSNSLVINILDEPDATAQRDGILNIHPGWTGGAKAGHLGQLVSLVSPSHWEAYFDGSPADILKLFSKTDWSETLLRGCMEATVFHQNPVWAAALVGFWQENEGWGVWDLPIANQLFDLLQMEEVNRLAIKSLNETTGLPTEGTLVFRLLKNGEVDWSDELSLLIVNRFRQEIVRDYRQIWQLQHLSGYLQMLGLRCNPALFDQLQTGWSSDSVQWRIWEKPVEDMLARVLFRREMRAEIIKSHLLESLQSPAKSGSIALKH